MHEEGVIDRLFLHHVQGVAVLGGEGRGEGEEDDDDEGQTHTYCAARTGIAVSAVRTCLQHQAPHCAALVWGYLRFARFAPSGLLKEVVYYIVAARSYCLLPIAFCLLPSAYCLLPTAYCLLP